LLIQTLFTIVEGESAAVQLCSETLSVGVGVRACLAEKLESCVDVAVR
jgi:hypothetical protein